jgi:Uma2 family endonuclease
MASTIKNLITVDQLDQYPDDGNRYEIIEGELFVSRAHGIPHQRVLQNLQVALLNYLANKPIGILVPGAGAVFSDYDAVIPDLVLVRNERWDTTVANDRFVKAPDLVVEILSPGHDNRRRDTHVKRKLYAKYGVNEYWLVDPHNQSVIIFCLNEETLTGTAQLTGEVEITSNLLPGLCLKVSDIFKL